MDPKKEILDIKELTIEFASHSGWNRVVENLSLSLYENEILAVVGESGSGKSVTCSAITRLLPENNSRISSGEIIFSSGGEKTDLLSCGEKHLRKIRGGRIAYIFQEPGMSLNPVMNIGAQITESLKLHRPEIKDRKAEVISLLKKVGINSPEHNYRAYPHELSGGMQQRVMIAMALACQPDILIADEPTTALDVSIQAKIVDLLMRLKDDTGMSIIFITHNLALISHLADRIAVMYKGKIVELGKTEDIINKPQHPYTESLLAAVPRLIKPDSRNVLQPSTAD